VGHAGAAWVEYSGARRDRINAAHGWKIDHRLPPSVAPKLGEQFHTSA
jgi:hypothetical protein